MVQRRQLIGAGILSGIASLATSSRADAGQAQVSDRALGEIAKSIDSLESEMDSQWQFAEIQTLRGVQLFHLRVVGKLPDYIEVGTDAFFKAHDWHIRWQQPLMMGRDAQGRYTLILMQTMLILRTDQMQSYVGLPYDNERL